MNIYSYIYFTVKHSMLYFYKVYCTSNNYIMINDTNKLNLYLTNNIWDDIINFKKNTC